MPTLLLAFAIILATIGCASSSRQAEPPCWRKEQCLAMTYPENEWYWGSAENILDGKANAAEFRRMLEQQARVKMAERISMNISGSTTLDTKSNLRSKDGLSSEEISRDFFEAIQTSTNAKLFNSFVDSYYDSKSNAIYAFAAVRKTDAAKGFLERQRLVADSLELASNALLAAEHPKSKNEAWRKTHSLWVEFARNKSLLDGLGVESSYPADEIYSKAKENYTNYCQGMKVFWQDDGSNCSKAVFAVLSRRNIKMEESGCSGGLKLSLSCLEKCKPYAVGTECSSEPSLSIESCGGEKFSLLKAGTPVTGNDPHSANKAKEKLLENFPKSVFFNEWEKEIKEWLCTN